MRYYVCSDLHGCYDRYQALLQRMEKDSVLYLLGDFLDRGPEGLRILLDALERPNVELIAGNHELTAALLLPKTVQEVTQESLEHPEELMGWLEDIAAWREDGGGATLAEFRILTQAQRRQVLEELEQLPVYEELSVEGNHFILTHGGLGEAPDPRRPLEEYSIQELLFTRPNLSKPWESETYVVFGHTPTRYYFAREAGLDLRTMDPSQYRDEIYRRGRWIGIDCGCGQGGRLGCLCLNTLEELYI